jgi:hypothetical protein
VELHLNRYTGTWRETSRRRIPIRRSSSEIWSPWCHDRYDLEGNPLREKRKRIRTKLENIAWGTEANRTPLRGWASHESYSRGPCYGVSSVGETRWIWVVWPQGAGGEPGSFGYEETKEHAIAAALRAIEPLASTLAPYPLSAGFAAHWHRVLVAKARQKRGPKAGGTSTVEYVYHVSQSDYSGEVHVRPVRIIKKTKKRVFIPDDYGNDKAGYNYAGAFISKTIALDRQKLETKGYASARGRWWATFYREPPQPSSNHGAPPHLVEHLEVLGLSWPCTQDSIKQAYRAKAREHHPDTGGDAEMFKAVREAFEVLEQTLGGKG